MIEKKDFEALNTDGVLQNSPCTKWCKTKWKEKRKETKKKESEEEVPSPCEYVSLTNFLSLYRCNENQNKNTDETVSRFLNSLSSEEAME